MLSLVCCSRLLLGLLLVRNGGERAAFLSWEMVAVKARCFSLEILRGRKWCNGAGTGAVGAGAAALWVPLAVIGDAEDGELGTGRCSSAWEWSLPLWLWLHAPVAPVSSPAVAAANPTERRRPHWAHRERTPLPIRPGLIMLLALMVFEDSLPTKIDDGVDGGDIDDADVPPIMASRSRALVVLIETATAAPVVEPVMLCR